MSGRRLRRVCVRGRPGDGRGLGAANHGAERETPHRHCRHRRNHRWLRGIDDGGGIQSPVRSPWTP